jgi:RNA polymerase sigma-70 factor (ECF subfamily)
MYWNFALSSGAGLPFRSSAERFSVWPMTVPRAVAGATPDELADLVQAIVERRDQSAFAALFDYYSPRVKAYLKRLGTSDGMAEEVAQEAMLTVWRKAEAYDRHKATVGTWIFTIARNLRTDMWRRERHRDLDPTDPRISPEPAVMPDREVEAAREEAQVRAALKSLPDVQTKIIALAFYEGKSHGDIAAALSIPLGTVKSRMRLAFLKLRGLVGERI